MYLEYCTMYHGTRDTRRVQTDSAKGAGSLCVSPWYGSTTFRDRPRNTQCSNATEINSIARLGNGTASPLPGYVTGRLHIARLGNGTTSILPGCVTEQPRACSVAPLCNRLSWIWSCASGRPVTQRVTPFHNRHPDT